MQAHHADSKIYFMPAKWVQNINYYFTLAKVCPFIATSYSILMSVLALLLPTFLYMPWLKDAQAYCIWTYPGAI